jgi:hypothetical protein
LHALDISWQVHEILVDLAFASSEVQICGVPKNVLFDPPRADTLFSTALSGAEFLENECRSLAYRSVKLSAARTGTRQRRTGLSKMGLSLAGDLKLRKLQLGRGYHRPDRFL